MRILNYNPEEMVHDWRILAMQALEKDIVYLCRFRPIYNVEREDVEQELRLFIWDKLPNYNSERSSIRTWFYMEAKGKLYRLTRTELRRYRREILFASAVHIPCDDQENQG